MIAFTGEEFSIDSGFIESKTIIESDDTDVGFLQAVIDVGEGDLTIRDATDYLWTGKFREFSSKPEYKLERIGDSARVTLATTSDRIWGGVVKIETDEPNDWHLAFSRSIPLDLQCVQRVVATLMPERRNLWQMGGSHAQRDLFFRLLLAAALKAGRFRLARALAAERNARNPNSVWCWKREAAALDGLGETAMADAARKRAAALLAA